MPEPLLNGLRVTDFVCEVRARIVRAADGGWGLGLIKGSGESSPWTGIYINGIGQVSSHSQLANLKDLAWLSAPAMHMGEQANTLRVEAKGARIRIFINGQFVAERIHQRLQPDSGLTLFCFGSFPPEDVRIQSVQVWVPKNGSSMSMEE